jgi:hypothetical protein
VLELAKTPIISTSPFAMISADALSDSQMTRDWRGCCPAKWGSQERPKAACEHPGGPNIDLCARDAGA